MNNNAILVAGKFSRHFLAIIACFQTVIIIIPLPITYWGDQVVTPTGLNTKNPWLK